MKKNYIQPIVTVSSLYTLEKLLADSAKRFSTWGNGTDSHGNKNWVNEGYSGDIISIDNDAGTIDSQTKGRGSDWGNIW